MKKITLYTFALLSGWAMTACSESSTSETEKEVQDSVEVKISTPENYYASKAENITIDGLVEESDWEEATWAPMENRWLGEEYTEDDFQGKYKALWDEEYIYLLVEVVDDTVVDFTEAPFESYWNDDCVEIFIDENNGDENHQFNHNAFAYHVALDYNVVDIGPDSTQHFYNDHITAKRTQVGKVSTWEIAMKVYTDKYVDDAEDNENIKLELGKNVGFMIAYCDNDKSENRENFVGSIKIEPVGPEKDTDRGWIDAGVFGDLTLVE